MKRRVVDGGDDPYVVAGEYEISIAALLHALAYYYDNRAAFLDREREAAIARAEGDRRTRELLRYCARRRIVSTELFSLRPSAIHL